MWYWIFQFALHIESMTIKVRDIAQHQKMKLIKPVPEFWENMRSW